ncbi:YeiH family protein [Psychroflexus aestuariivivens]|uniref:YeiH family protein n=1 Tax=Psychroflexus aestuariivivens TaxID=1795040 RepID=UPI000FD98387|nr:putative sulfate exporter family transporter [Psychroflexus aestuariivivens]
MMKKIVKWSPGVFLALGLTFLAEFISEYSFWLNTTSLALIFGIVLANIPISLKPIQSGMAFSEKNILETAIVLIGFGLNFSVLGEINSDFWWFILFSVLAVIALALFFGKIFKLDPKLNLLLGAGSAICGSAAIGAISPILKSKESETGMAIGIINLLSTIGLFLLPIVAVYLHFSQDETSFFIGGVLQSMGHVVGAGFSVNEEVGVLATVIKMGRVLLLIPLLLIVYVTFSSKNQAQNQNVGFPFFIIFFLVAIGFSQFSFISEAMTSEVSSFGNFLLNVAMVGIGYKIKLKSLFQIAGKSLILGVLLFLFQILLFISYINYF